jgi:hypothetical protein
MQQLNKLLKIQPSMIDYHGQRIWVIHQLQMVPARSRRAMTR